MKHRRDLSTEITIGDIDVSIGVHGDSLSLEQPKVFGEEEKELVLMLGLGEIIQLHTFLGAAIDRRNQLTLEEQSGGDLLRYCEKVAKEVATWPEWKREGADVTKFLEDKDAIS